VLSALPTGSATAERNPKREAWLAALNGVWGDHLVDNANPLTIAMSLRSGGRALDLAAPLGSLSCEPSGRHVWHNGRDFAALLARLVAAWPVPLQAQVIVGHSMGGLVARSACHVDAGQAWLGKLTRLVSPGTPHHGAPLERGGRLVDTLFGISPYVAPFARLGKARSAGITDLRYRNVQEADIQPDGRHAQRHDDRHPTPLPAGVQAFVAAAPKAPAKGAASGLGDHHNPALALHVPERHRLVAESANHWDLLNRDEVGAKLREWLA
jgi:pimeloyl-ACP methyl ester carboxylesterase